MTDVSSQWNLEVHSTAVASFNPSSITRKYFSGAEEATNGAMRREEYERHHQDHFASMLVIAIAIIVAVWRAVL
jgi:hypothetical protein